MFVRPYPYNFIVIIINIIIFSNEKKLPINKLEDILGMPKKYLAKYFIFSYWLKIRNKQYSGSGSFFFNLKSFFSLKNVMLLVQ